MPRTTAPDDDEDFLRDLNRRNRRRKNPDKPTGDTGPAAGSDPPQPA
jgi:hypothetical protein